MFLLYFRKNHGFNMVIVTLYMVLLSHEVIEREV
jgi:hypothetical protein